MEIKKAVQILKKGGIIIYPTETAYAIGCDILNKKSLKKVIKIKGRRKTKFTCIVSDLKMAKKYGKISKSAEKIIKKFMPGPLTLIVTKKKIVPNIFNKEFAFRISSNKIAQKLVKKFGKPILATSANISGKKPLYSIKSVKKLFENKVNLVVGAGNLRKKPVSTVLRMKDMKILRRGLIKKRQLMR